MVLNGFLFSWGFVLSLLNCCKILLTASSGISGICGSAMQFLNSCSTSACLHVSFQDMVQRNLSMQVTRWLRCPATHIVLFAIFPFLHHQYHKEQLHSVGLLRWRVTGLEVSSHTWPTQTGNGKALQELHWEVEKDIEDGKGENRDYWFPSLPGTGLFFLPPSHLSSHVPHAAAHPWSEWKAAVTGWLTLTSGRDTEKQ